MPTLWTRLRTPRRWAGVLLLRVPVALAVAAASVAVGAVLLLGMGWWRPGIALPVVAVLAGAGAWATRVVVVRPVPVWSALLTVLIGAGSGVWAAVTHAENILVRRDPAPMALYGHWLATRGSLPMDASAPAFGSALADPAFTLSGLAYTQVGDHIEPQFLPGAPSLFSVGYWLGGWPGLLTTPAVLGAGALLAVASVAARVIGPTWAPLAAAVLALAQPILHAWRTTLSEPAALLVLAAAIALLCDALVRNSPHRSPVVHRGATESTAMNSSVRVAQSCAARAAGAGLLLGASGLIRADALREIILAIPVAAVLVARRDRAGWALAAAIAVSGTLAALADVSYSRLYIRSLLPSLRPLLAGGAFVCLVCAAAVAWVRRRPGMTLPRQLPAMAGTAIVVAAIALATRPWWITAHQAVDASTVDMVARQKAQHLAIDGQRTYAEHTLTWVSWYLGWPTIVLAGAAAVAVGVRTTRSLRDGSPLPVWAPAAFIGLGSTVLALWRPAITPDHPWADRRLVTGVLPVIALLATAALAHLVRRLVAEGRPGPTRLVARFAGTLALAAGMGAVLVPVVKATAPLAGQRTELGEIDAVKKVCAALSPGDVVLAVDSGARFEWLPAVRGICAVPAGAITTQSLATDANARASAARISADVRDAGGRPVILAASGGYRAIARLGLEPVRLLKVTTTEDPKLLERRPDGSVDRLTWVVYLSRPAG